MSYQIVLSSDAIIDIDGAVEHYNKISFGLGFEFVNTLEVFFNNISRLPVGSAIRYDNVRVKPIDTFPYTIHFIISSSDIVIILCVFNTNQQPFW
jgi:hypothetical protein